MLTSQLSFESVHSAAGDAGNSEILDREFDVVICKQLDDVVEATSRQPDVTGIQFGAGDDARLAKGWEPHSLRSIEFRILKGGDPDEPRHHSWRQFRAVKIELIRKSPGHPGRERRADRTRIWTSGRRHVPRLIRILFVYWHPNA